MPDYAELREWMIERQIAARGIADPRLLQAFRDVPRDLFVDAPDRPDAYGDSPLPIAAGQTISQPYIVALMIEAVGLRPGAHVLEVGAGSGYAAAVMGRIARSVISVERHGELARLAAARMKHLGYDNVRVVHGDGALGMTAAAPFDAILLAAAGREVPHALLEQLRPGGVLVMPLGAPDAVQQLIRVTRRDDGTFGQDDLGAVRFVPLLPGVSHPFD